MLHGGNGHELSHTSEDILAEGILPGQIPNQTDILHPLADEGCEAVELALASDLEPCADAVQTEGDRQYAGHDNQAEQARHSGEVHEQRRDDEDCGDRGNQIPGGIVEELSHVSDIRRDERLEITG